MIDAVALGHHLRSARERRGLSVAAVVTRLGELGVRASEDKLWAWERGDRLPPVDAAVGLMVALHPIEGVGFFREALDPIAWKALQGQ